MSNRSIRQRRIITFRRQRVSEFYVGGSRGQEHIKGAAIGAKLFYARVAFARMCTYAHRGVYTVRDFLRAGP